MTELIQDKEEIDKIIQEKIKVKKLIFTKYYHLRLTEKGLEHTENHEKSFNYLNI